MDAEPAAVRAIPDRGVGDAHPGSVQWWMRRRLVDARRRPRADGLTTERIVDAAIAIVDAEGPDALTVRRLADAFGTSSASLYRHIASRDELLVLMVDQGLGAIDLSPATATAAPGAWRADAERVLASVRDVTLRHPRFVPITLAFPLRGPNFYRLVDRLIAAFGGAGLAPEQATYAVTTCLNYVFGVAALQASAAARRADRLGSGEDVADAVVPEGCTELRALAGTLALVSPDDVFRNGLAIVFDGIASRFGISSG